MQPRNKKNARGIDVSHWQGNIDWTKVKANDISFAFIKATEGKTIIDPKFSTNLKNAKSVGILVGAYHFCRAKDVTAAQKEAEHFINTINKNGGFKMLNLPPALDIETSEGKNKATITAICKEWIKQVKKVSGIQPMIYTYLNFARNFLDKSLANTPLWFARYNKNEPENVAGWTRWTFLQYTNKGSVEGILGYVDMNEYCETVEKLKNKYGEVKMSETLKLTEAEKQILRACGQITEYIADKRPIYEQVAWLMKNYEQYKKDE